MITKIHKILEFRQEAFASGYVISNYNIRKEASCKKDAFGKDFFKFMNNYCDGQMMMNEKRVLIRDKEIRGQNVSKRKIDLSNAKCLDWYDPNNSIRMR